MCGQPPLACPCLVPVTLSPSPPSFAVTNPVRSFFPPHSDDQVARSRFSLHRSRSRPEHTRASLFFVFLLTGVDDAKSPPIRLYPQASAQAAPHSCKPSTPTHLSRASPTSSRFSPTLVPVTLPRRLPPSPRPSTRFAPRPPAAPAPTGLILPTSRPHVPTSW